MVAEFFALAAQIRAVAPEALILLGGVLIGIGVKTLVDEGRIAAARDLEDAAAEGERLRSALFEATGPLPAVKPAWRVRVRLAGRDARDWARTLFTSEALPDWAPGEILALPESQLAPRPPLRRRNPLPQSRLKWPLKRPVPSPLELARRLASHYDPQRWRRVEVIAR